MHARARAPGTAFWRLTEGRGVGDPRASAGRLDFVLQVWHCSSGLTALHSATPMLRSFNEAVPQQGVVHCARGSQSPEGRNHTSSVVPQWVAVCCRISPPPREFDITRTPPAATQLLDFVPRTSLMVPKSGACAGAPHGEYVPECHQQPGSNIFTVP